MSLRPLDVGVLLFWCTICALSFTRRNSFLWCKKEDLDLSVDSDTRDVYIKAKRTVKNNDSEKQLTLNRSFSVGRDYDLKKIKFNYEDGMLEVNAPRRKKEEYIKKYTI